MNGWFWGMLAGGVVLAVWNVWQHRGRSRTARAWAHDWMGSFKVKSVLVLRPLLVVALICGGLLPLASNTDPTLVICSVLFMGSLLGIVVFFLPLPIPRFAMPRWYRDEIDSGRTPGRGRGTRPVETPREGRPTTS